MAQNLTIVGFDADDTLWHNERFFHLTQARFAELLADFVEGDHLADRLLEAERRNIGHYGFGVKGFVLSMIETAIEVTDGRVPTSVISELMDAGREMLRYPIELLPHAEDAVRAVSETHKTVLITKGDLLDQDRKLAQSGLGDFFDGVEIVSDKSLSTYQTIFKRFGTPMENAMMVGNSMRSDVVPVVEGGGWGVFVPHGLEWDLEKADPPKDAPRFATLDDLSGLETLIAQIG